MTDFWVFLIVLVICITIVICVYISNATFPNAYWLERRLDETDRKLRELKKMLAEKTGWND